MASGSLNKFTEAGELQSCSLKQLEENSWRNLTFLGVLEKLSLKRERSDYKSINRPSGYESIQLWRWTGDWRLLWLPQRVQWGPLGCFIEVVPGWKVSIASQEWHRHRIRLASELLLHNNATVSNGLWPFIPEKEKKKMESARTPGNFLPWF